MTYQYQNSRGVTYYLHAKEITFKNGMVRNIYFFAKDIRDNSLPAVPTGYKVVESQKTGLPVLKKVISL